jgi:hypothetical protein
MEEHDGVADAGVRVAYFRIEHSHTLPRIRIGPCGFETAPPPGNWFQRSSPASFDTPRSPITPAYLHAGGAIQLTADATSAFHTPVAAVSRR